MSCLRLDLGIDLQAFIESRRHQLSAAPVAEGSTVASVYEYAAAQPRYRTGQDPVAVTDDHLRVTIANLNA